MRNAMILIIMGILLSSLLGIFHIGGMLLVCGVLMLAWRLMRGKPSIAMAGRVVAFLLDFIADLVRSNLLMLWDVFTAKDYHQVQLVKVPIGDLADWEVALLNHRINLSPGTLVYRISDDRQYIYVHNMYSKGKDIADQMRAPIDLLRGKTS